MVKFAMSQAIIEPNLMKKCNFKDLKGASNEEQFYIALACDFGLVGQNDNFRPFEMTKRKEAALALARFAFGTEFIKAETNQFNEAMRLLYDAYVMKNITDADTPITKGQLIMMLQRVDYGEVLNNSRYIRLLEQEKNQ